MPILNLNRDTISSCASDRSWQRGLVYYQDGCVNQICQRGQSITAQVRGSRSYRVTVNFDAEGLSSASCSCPYDWGGYCKHIVATLLICLHEPHKVQLCPSLEQILDRLNEIQTQNLIQQLVANQPELLDDIEHFADRLVPSEVVEIPVSKSYPVTINPNRIRSQVRKILEDSVRHFEYGGEEDIATEEILSSIQEAQMHTQQEDYGNAIAMLTAITEACVENWDIVDEYGVDNGEVATELNEIWCETILSADLSEAETTDLQVNFAYWREGWGGYFDMAIAALSQGWHYPPLQQVLQGIGSRAWSSEVPDYAGDLALIRLQILARQQRFEEYLYLALAEGQITEYLTMLVKLERVLEAMQAARSKMSTMEEALAFSQALVNEQNALSEALAIAQRGWELPGRCQYEIATWASEIAEEVDDRTIATKAKVKAFQARPNFTDYQQVEQLAGEHWSNIKGELLGTLTTIDGWSIDQAKINIYLYEGLVDKAIATIDDSAYFPSNLIHRVMDAAIESKPDWVIERGCQRAEPIMNAGKAKYYREAIEWLKKVRNAYLATERQQEWSDYRTKLITTHARKRKLMDLMQSVM